MLQAVVAGDAEAIDTWLRSVTIGNNHEDGDAMEQSDRDVLNSLWGGLGSNKWLRRHPRVTRAWAPELRILGKWLVANPAPWPLRTRRERSLEILGDEKLLMSGGKRRAGFSFGTVVRFSGISNDQLGIAPTCEQDDDVSGSSYRMFSVGDFSRRNALTFVISENLDPWRAMRNGLVGSGATTVFGTRVDGAIFGEGNRIMKQGDIDLVADCIRAGTGFSGIISFLWWGDLDKAGLNQLARAQAQTREVLSPFAAAYARMLEVADIDNLPADTSHDRVPDWIVAALTDEMDEKGAELLRQVLERGLRLPQEITRVETEVTKGKAVIRREPWDGWKPAYIQQATDEAAVFGEAIDGIGQGGFDEDNVDPYDDAFDGYDEEENEGGWGKG